MKIINIIFLVALLSACTQKPVNVKKYYRLELKSQAVSNEQVNEQLWVKRPDAHSILGNRPFVASDINNALQQLSHHAWIESPKVLLQELFQQYFQNSWDSVRTERPRTGDYFQLHSRILAFEKQQNKAFIKIAFSFYNQDKVLINHTTLSSVQTFSGNQYADFAQAMSLALNDILSQLELKP